MNVSVRLYFSLLDDTASDSIRWLSENFKGMRLHKFSKERNSIEAEVAVPMEVYETFSHCLRNMRIMHREVRHE